MNSTYDGGLQMKIKSRDIKVFLTGGILSCVVIGGVWFIPLSKNINELQLKNEQNIQINNDLMDKNTELINKNNKKSKELIKKNKKIMQLEEKIKNFEFKSVNFNPNDVTQLTDIKPRQLEILFKSNSTYKNLIGLEQAFVDAEKQYGVNAIFLLGIVSQESGFASSRRAVEENNLTGYAIYQNSSKKAFNSQYESVMATAKLLRDNYIEGRNIKDIENINEIYCPNDNYKWSNNIQRIIQVYLDELEGINSRFNA